MTPVDTSDGTSGQRLWLEQLASWRGRPADYWRHLAQVARELLSARSVWVCWRQVTSQADGAWQTLAREPAQAGVSDCVGDVPESMWQRSLSQSVVIERSASGSLLLALAVFRLEQEQRELCLLAVLPEEASAIERASQALAALAWLPRLFESRRAHAQSERDAIRLAQVLETVGRLLQAEHFERAALILANDLAERFACESVAVCWKAREGLKLRALSHTEKIDRRSEASALLEEAGQESLSQELEIVWPTKDKSIKRAHERYAQLQHPGHLCTLPLLQIRGPGYSVLPWGSITLERQKMAFTQAEQWALRLYADMALGPLLQAYQQARALPLRLAREVGRSLPAAAKPRSLSGRYLFGMMAVVLMGLGLTPLPHSVTAGASVKTDTMAFVGAPFDGFLDSHAVQLGTAVRAGQPLFAISTRELVLERTSIQAEIAQASREADKRRAANQLAEMQVAEAQVAQGRAKLTQVQNRLKAAEVVAPIDGVVIEGEPGKNLGGAVRRGDTVVKIAAMSSLYVEAAVSEKDLSWVGPGLATRLTLLAQPAQTYALSVERIIPQASVVDGQNTFAVRLKLSEAASDWWRPGMTGVAKISVGWRPLGWILTHRFIDYLRLTFWF